MVCERPPAAFGGSPPHEGENKAKRLQEIGARSKRTFAVSMTATGVPLSNVGSYCHCLTHVIAASISRGCPEITRISSTVPCAVRVASRTTIPLTRAFDASVGYIGG